MRRVISAFALAVCVPLLAGCSTSTPIGELKPRSEQPLAAGETRPAKEKNEVLRSAYGDTGLTDEYGGGRVEVDGRYELEVACKADGAKAWWWVVVDGDVESWGTIECGKKYRIRVLRKTHASHTVNVHLGNPQIDGEDAKDVQWGYARLLKVKK